MRADRLLSILLLLQTQRRMTTRQLAEQLEVSPRTIHRDMDALSGAGVPVTGQRGQGGGWELLEPYRTDLTGLTSEESQAIFLDALPPSIAALGLDEAARSARIKLLAALSSSARTSVEYTRQRLHIDPTGWSRSPDSVELLPVIQDGIWMNKVVQLSYQRADGKVVEREVHPLGLVAKGQTWYLVGAVKEGMRTYRVSRILAAGLCEDDAVRPEGFNLRSYWEASMAEFQTRLPQYLVRLEVSAKILPRVGFGISFARVEETGEPGSDGWTPVTINFGVPDEAIAFVLRFPEDVRIIDPPEVRDKVLERARVIVELFGRADEGLGIRD
jgi:predicted DNA-binding transcriptional regulator YafY